MSAIELWFDGGGLYGFGNVRRARELGEALLRRGHSIRFVPLSARAGTLLGRDEGNADTPVLAVLDVPYEGDAMVRAARARSLEVVALDFDGTVAPDLVISLAPLRRIPPGCRFVCGVEFAIIREEIRALGTRHETTDEVLVIVGGGDHDNLTLRIVERMPELRLCVVSGPAGPALNIKREALRVVTNPADLPQLMAGCAWAVTTGGTTMLEMMCLGKAVHVVPRTKQEQAFAQQFASAGVLLGLGPETLSMPSSDEINICEQRGPQLIDGRGCERIAVEIESLL